MRKIQYTVLIACVAVLFTTACKRTNIDINNMYTSDITLPTLNDKGDTIKLSEFKGYPLAINFWASWCIPCRVEMPFLELSWKQYKDKGVKFIGINVMNEKKGAQDYLNELGVTFHNLYDPNGEIANSFNVAALPVTFFVDKSGRIVNRNFGGIIGEEGELEFRSNLEALLR